MNNLFQNSKIIDGKKIAAKHEEKLKEEVKKLGLIPCGVNILIGDEPSSVLYTQIKEKKAKELGISFKTLRFSLDVQANPPHTTHFVRVRGRPPRWNEVVRKIEEMNRDSGIQGIMVQLPVPEGFLRGYAEDELLGKIAPKKDIDGLNYVRRTSLFIPAVVKAILLIIEDQKIEVKGKKVVIVGKSDLVGKPAALELAKLGGQIIVCDSKTVNLKEETLKADILIAAAGVPHLIKGDMVKKGVVVIDVGAEKVDGKLKGDIEFESVFLKASKITPVPGGVGPVTVMALFKNMIQCIKQKKYGYL